MPGLIAALLLVPIVEIFVLVKVEEAIGAVPTILLLILDAVLGAWLIRHQGRRAWLALMESLSAGRMPTKELADGALILIGGTLLIAPGFLTDILGLFLVLPFTRPLARRGLVVWASSRISVAGGRGAPPRRRGPGGGRVVSGEVVDDDRGPQN
jgi:UPF0716 protein FxsA